MSAVNCLITIDGEVAPRNALKSVRECIYILSSTECAGAKIGQSTDMYNRLRKLLTKVLVLDVVLDVFVVNNCVAWERFIHSWLRNRLIAGEVFDTNREEAIWCLKHCFGMQLDSNAFVPVRSRYFSIFVNQVPQVSLPQHPHLMVVSVPGLERVLLYFTESPRSWFEEFLASSLHTHCILDAYNVGLLLKDTTVESVKEDLGATTLTGWVINKTRAQVVDFLNSMMLR